MSRKFEIYPFCDGTEAEVSEYRANAKKRRSALNGIEAVDKIISYLEQVAEVLDYDLKRYRKIEDAENFLQTKHRLKWTENMISWINHNV